MLNSDTITKRRQFFYSISVLSILACAVYFLAVPAYKADAKKKAKSNLMLATTTFPTSTGPLPVAIPDNNSAGVDFSIPVSGLTDDLRGVSVNMTFNPQHTWLGDLTAIVRGPGMTPSHTLFSNVGPNDSSDLVGPYTFTDGTTGDFWAAASSSGSGVPVPAGSYRTTSAGSPVFTEMNPVFQGPVLYDPVGVSSLKSENTPTDNVANGTWTVNVADNAGGDTGSISAMSLTLTTLAPTAATAAIRGSVMNSADQPVIRARVSIFDTQTGERLTAVTNQFGYYRFEDLPVGHFYVMSVEHRIYQFEQQSFTLDEDRQNDFRSNGK